VVDAANNTRKNPHSGSREACLELKEMGKKSKFAYRQPGDFKDLRPIRTQTETRGAGEIRAKYA